MSYSERQKEVEEEDDDDDDCETPGRMSLNYSAECTGRSLF